MNPDFDTILARIFKLSEDFSIADAAEMAILEAYPELSPGVEFEFGYHGLEIKGDKQ